MTKAPVHRPDARARVLYVINDLCIGGAQRALLSQAAALDPERFEVHVASLELAAGGPLARDYREAGVAVHAFEAPGVAFGLAPFRLQALIGRWRPDIVHTHLAAAGVVGRTAAHARRVPHVVSTLHNVTDWVDRRRHPLRALDRATLPLAHRVCAVSNAVREAVTRAMPRLATRVVTLRNGIAVERFRLPEGGRAAARAQLRFAPADF